MTSPHHATQAPTKRVSLICLAGLSLCLSACVIVPVRDLETAHTLSTELPSDWHAAHAFSRTDQVTASTLYSLFPDETVHDLVNEALKNNPDLRAANYRVRASYFALAPVRASRLPGLNASTSFQFDSMDGDIAHTRTSGLGLQWRPDIWGRLSADISAAEATHHAAELDYATAKLSLSVGVMQAWLAIWSTDQEYRILDEQIQAMSKLEALQDLRYSSGLSPLADKLRTASQRAQLESQRHSTQNALETSKRALEVLLGRYPANHIEGPTDNVEILTASLSPPAQLLVNRPDIQAAYHRLESAVFTTRSAARALLPDITLGANVSRNDVDNPFVPDLADWSSLINVDQILFDGGALLAAARAQRENTHAQLEAYKSVVLTAVQDVENGLSTDAALRKKLISITNAQSDLEKALRELKQRYSHGLANFEEVLSSQIELANLKLERQSVLFELLDNRLRLALALGLPLPQSQETDDD